MESPFAHYDARGVIPVVRYSPTTGMFTIECLRKKRTDESGGDNDWRMVREGYIGSFLSREDAEKAVLAMAERICTENGF